MIICLDGVDGSGKSTLADQIVKELEKRYPEDTVIYKHATQIKDDVYTEYADLFNNYKPNSGTHYVLDRWYLGEEIYGPLYRGKSAFDTVSFRWVDLFLASKGFRLWLVTQTEELLSTRLTSRGEDFLKMEDISFVQNKYKELVKKATTFAKEISPKNYDTDLLNIIIKDAVYAEQMANVYATQGVNYFGRTFTMPRTILVLENKKNNKNFDPRINEDARKILEVLPEGYWNTFSVVSSGNLDVLEEFLNNFLWSTNPVAYGETVVARLKYKNVEFSEIKPPEVSDNYSYHIRVMADRARKL